MEITGILNDCKNGLLYIDISFDNKHLIKNISGRFDSKFKLWFVNYDVSRTSLEKLLNMQEKEKYIVRFPKYLNNTKIEWDRQEVISLLDSYKKPKYCCCCGKSLVAIGSRRKNGISIIDWSTRNTHKSCYLVCTPLKDFMIYDVNTGKKLIK
jgi:hypothetical protein